MSIPSTKTLYFESSTRTECDARVLAIEDANGYKQPGCGVVILDQTVCYPQGGGQPSDTGVMVQKKNKNKKFEIFEARMDRETNRIQHFGKFLEEPFSLDDEITVKIDADKRLLFSRLHSAGHCIDASLNLLGYNWLPSKASHFPDNLFVEYQGEIDPAEIEQLKKKIEEKTKELISDDVSVKIQLDVSQEKATEMCGGYLDPVYLKAPTLRMVSIGDYFHGPCGGTHVQSMSQLKGIQIPKIKATPNKKLIKISYKLAS